MPIFLPLFVAAASLFALSCSREEGTRIEPEDLIIGPEPPPRTMPKVTEPRLSGEAREVMKSFRELLEEKGAFRGLSAPEQRRLEESFQANSLHGFFDSMMGRGKEFETAGRFGPALAIFEGLSESRFPVPLEMSHEARNRATALKTMRSPARP